MPTNERGMGVRLSSGPEHIVPIDRPVIVTQSDLQRRRPSCSSRGSPYSGVERHAAMSVDDAAELAARPLQLKLGGTAPTFLVNITHRHESRGNSDASHREQ